MRPLFLLTVAALGAGIAHAQPQRQPMRPRNPLLAKVFEKGASLTYEGQREVFVLRRNVVQRYQEVISKKGPNLKIKFFGGEDINNQIIVENAKMRWHYIPKRNEIRESPARQEESLMFLIGPMMMGESSRPSGGNGSGNNRGGNDGDRKRGNGGRSEQRAEPVYKESDGGYLVNMRTRLLTLKDASGDRVFVKLWIEPNNGIILKRIAYGPKGEELGGFEFKRISFRPKFSSSTFQPPSVAGAKKATVEDILKSEAKKLSMKPYRLQGDSEYLLLSARGFEQDRSKIVMQVYTNGRSRLTLFQVKGKFDSDRFKTEAGSGFTAHTWQMDGVNFAIVGNLEAEKLKALAKKVKA